MPGFLNIWHSDLALVYNPVAQNFITLSVEHIQFLPATSIALFKATVKY